jgi:hypothetical protein
MSRLRTRPSQHTWEYTRVIQNVLMYCIAYTNKHTAAALLGFIPSTHTRPYAIVASRVLTWHASKTTQERFACICTSACVCVCLCVSRVHVIDASCACKCLRQTLQAGNSAHLSSPCRRDLHKKLPQACNYADGILSTLCPPAHKKKETSMAALVVVIELCGWVGGWVERKRESASEKETKEMNSYETLKQTQITWFMQHSYCTLIFHFDRLAQTQTYTHHTAVNTSLINDHTGIRIWQSIHISTKICVWNISSTFALVLLSSETCQAHAEVLDRALYFLCIVMINHTKLYRKILL